MLKTKLAKHLIKVPEPNDTILRKCNMTSCEHNKDNFKCEVKFIEINEYGKCLTYHRRLTEY